ncbi:MAG: sodium:solute symporter family protein [Oscillospiraceae bacterium]
MNGDMIQIWSVVALYVIAMVTIGIVSSKKTKTLTDFVVGSRKAGAWVSAFAYGTTYFSAVLFIGYAGRSGWDFGLWAILIGVGNAFIGTYLAWKVLAGRTRDVTRRLKIKTMPQMFEKRYMSRKMKIFSSVLIFIFMTPYSASVYSGLSYLCETVLNVDYKWAMLVIAIISAVYLVLGGYIASLSADFVQGIIMIAGIILMVITVANHDIVGGFVHGIGSVVDKMSQAGLTSFSWEMCISLIGLILLTSLGSWGMPQMIQKFYGVADEKGIKRGTIISTGFAALISIGAYFIGSLLRLFFTEVPGGNYDQMIPTVLTSTLPAILLGVVLILVLSASVSTLSGITLTSCSTIAIDLVAGVLKPNISKKATFTLTRVLCLVFIAISYLIAISKTPILLLMSFSWGTISGAFLAPYLLGLWWKKMNKTGAWFGMIGGAGCSLVLAIVSGFNAGKAPIFGVIAMAFSFIMCIVGTLIGKKLGGKNSQVPEEFFDKSFTLQVGEGK